MSYLWWCYSGGFGCWFSPSLFLCGFFVVVVAFCIFVYVCVWGGGGGGDIFVYFWGEVGFCF